MTTNNTNISCKEKQYAISTTRRNTEPSLGTGRAHGPADAAGVCWSGHARARLVQHDSTLFADHERAQHRRQPDCRAGWARGRIVHTRCTGTATLRSGATGYLLHTAGAAAQLADLVVA